MAISVTCSNCGKSFRAAEQHAGKRAKCPSCGNPIVIPSKRSAPSNKVSARPEPHSPRPISQPSARPVTAPTTRTATPPESPPPPPVQSAPATPTNPSIAVTSEQPQPKGIAGWLIIPAIGLVLAPIKSVLMLFMGISMIQSLAPELTSDPRLWLSGFIDVAMIIATILVAILFFNRRRIAVGAIIGLLGASIVANITQALLNTAMFEEVGTDTINPVIHACVYAAIWIPYFLKSRRVKNTFIE